MASEDEVRAALRWQADYCFRSGSPIVGRVCAALAEMLDRSSLTGRRALDWPGNPVTDALPLRLAAPFHALQRSGRAPALDAVYGGGADLTQTRAAVGSAIAAHDAEIAGWMDGPPQTNEPGRSGVLMAGLLALAEAYPGIESLEILEIGSSAGLNLMIDRYGFDLGGVRVCPADAAIRIVPEWRGAAPPDTPRAIVSVRGCDIAPIDLSAPGQAERLLAYVWPDQPERLTRLEGAIAQALKHPPRLEQGDAAGWLKAQLESPQREGQARVLMHSVVWPYLPRETQAEITALMAAAGQRASRSRPLAWVTYEWGPEREPHELRLRTWPGSETSRLLANAHPHGAWIEWLDSGTDQG